MKLFLDDERPPPEGWIRVRWPEEVIEILKTGKVIELSLDHDLGDDAHGTGYDVILWIEQLDDFKRTERNRKRGISLEIEQGSP